jgi:hypothetical protein
MYTARTIRRYYHIWLHVQFIPFVLFLNIHRDNTYELLLFKLFAYMFHSFILTIIRAYIALLKVKDKDIAQIF